MNLAAASNRWRASMVFAIVSAALALTGCAEDYSPTHMGLVDEMVETRARESTLRVRAILCNGAGYASGSGFAINENTLVTNRHVAENTSLLQLSTWDGRDYSVSIGSVSYLNDLAILRVTGNLIEPLKIGSGIVEGQTVYAVGYPMGGAWTLTSGEVYDIVDGMEYGETGNVIRMTAGVEPGNSGGPLLDEIGNVVGVVFAQDLRNGLNLAISSERVEELAVEGESVGTRDSC